MTSPDGLGHTGHEQDNQNLVIERGIALQADPADYLLAGRRGVPELHGQRVWASEWTSRARGMVVVKMPAGSGTWWMTVAALPRPGEFDRACSSSTQV